MFSKLRFSKFRKIAPGQFLSSSSSHNYHWIFKLFVATWKSEVWKQSYVWLFNYFYFERSYDFFKSKSPYFLLNENINFGKNKTESKMENLTHSFRETNLCFSLHKNHELKVKLWWVGARERKEMHFCNVYFVQRNFFLFAFVFYLYVICI